MDVLLRRFTRRPACGAAVVRSVRRDRTEARLRVARAADERSSGPGQRRAPTSRASDEKGRPERMLGPALDRLAEGCQARRLVAVVLRLVRALDRHADVRGLLGGQLGELDAEVVEVQPG